MFDDIFKSRRAIPSMLKDFGFKERDGRYWYETGILRELFSLTVVIDTKGRADTNLIENDTGEEYILYKTTAQGTFVGEVRSAVRTVLEDIATKCCESSAFKFPQTLRVLEFARKIFGDEPEFLWSKFPDNAVLRRKDTQKWYAAVLSTSKSRIVPGSDGRAEIIDLRIAPDDMAGLLARGNYYPGWHMNKKSWYTVILDDSVADAELFEDIRRSWDLALK